MKKPMKFYVMPLSVLVFSVSTYGSTDLGEFCFTGNFPDEGNCVARIEVTQHRVNYSVLGKITCNPVPYTNGFTGENNSISGIVTGSGYISGNSFSSALSVINTTDKAETSSGTIYNIITSTEVSLNVNLSSMQAVFGKEMQVPSCGIAFTAPPAPPIYNRCKIETSFTSIACPQL